MTVRDKPFKIKNGKEYFMVGFYYDSPNGKKRLREVCPTPGKRAARDFDAKRRREVEEEAASQPEEVTKAELPTFKDWADEFMRTYAVANNAPSEQESKRLILNKHLLPRFGDRRLDQINRRDIEQLKADLLPGRAPATVNHILTVLRKLISYAVEVELLDRVPRFKLVKVPPQPFSFYDFEEYAQLLEALKHETGLLCAVLLAGDAGLRRGELTGLKWQDINFSLGRVTVMRSVWRSREKAPKSGRARTVPLTSRLRAALKAHRHLGEHVLLEDGKPWGGETYRRLGSRALRLASLPANGRFWHSLRHTFCSHLAMRGAPPRAIQELAGHADLQTTQRYLHLSPATLVNAIALLESEEFGQRSGQREAAQ